MLLQFYYSLIYAPGQHRIRALQMEPPAKWREAEGGRHPLSPTCLVRIGPRLQSLATRWLVQLQPLCAQLGARHSRSTQGAGVRVLPSKTSVRLNPETQKPRRTERTRARPWSRIQRWSHLPVGPGKGRAWPLQGTCYEEP